MQYGHFDDKNREYVITNPDTPMSWVNYLGNTDYCGIVSNNAAGYAFYKSSKTARLLRMRFNSIPTDRPGRYIYLRDNDTRDYWSAAWQPVAKPLTKYKSECRHGLGYTRFLSRYAGIKSNYRVFVPLGQPIEFWEITVENTTKKPRDLSLFSYAEWCFWEMQQDLTNFQYILYTCRMAYAHDTVDYTIRLWPMREPKGFMTSILPAVSFDTDRDEFMGTYRHEGQPKAVERGECFGSLAVGGNPCAAIQNRFTLQPGEKKRALFIIGVGDATTYGQECKAKYADPAAVEAEFAKLQDYWNGRLAGFSAKTPDPQTNSMVNLWNQYQCHQTFNWSRSASFNEAGGRDGLGYRDSTQDTLGIMHVIPELAQGKLLDLLKGQCANGSAMHHVQPLTWRQTPENIPSHPYSDDHLWLLLAIPAYLKETADFAFLDTVVPFADAGNASVYDHMKLSMEFSQSQRGPHGLLLGLAADWNDCINLRGKGESMFSTFLYYKALEELIILATRLGKAADAAHFTEYRDELKRNIDAHAWDGEWFLRGYLDSGRKLGGHESEQSRIFLNSQTWAVVSGAADPAKATSAMDSLHKYLATEHGCVKNYPAFRDHDAEIGAVTSFPPGLKENAGIFCHANTWAVIAECLLGRGSEAYKLYKAYLPAAKNDTADTYTMEPYVYSQFITGKEHHKFGRARNSWLTGTASWSFVAISQHILGLRATYDGLEIDPCIPPDWDGFTATRTYRGATYKITIKNPNHVSKGVKELKVNGKTIEGNQAPIAEPGQTVKVEATLG